MTADDDTLFRFGVNENGEYGYIIKKDGADTVIPFKSGGVILRDVPKTFLGGSSGGRYGRVALDISKLYDNYNNLTIDNIIVQFAKCVYTYNSQTSNLTYTYDNNTGIIEIIGTVACVYSAMTFDVAIVT